MTGEAAGSGTAADPPTGPHGYTPHKDRHLKRLRRIEGQIRGLQRMVEQDVYCIDVLTQVSAATKALQSFALQLLEEHLRHCVAAAGTDGTAPGSTDGTAPGSTDGGSGSGAGEDKVAEATAAIARLLRT